MDDYELKQPHHPSSCPQCKSPTQPDRPFCEECQFDLRYGSVRRTLAGVCIYCQRHARFSKEHIFPNWLRKIYPRRATQTDHELRRPERHALWETVPVHGHTVLRTGEPYEQVVLNVCAACNNGWMSALQDDVKPLLNELAEGRWPELSTYQCVQLARWCAMLSINFECFARMLTTTQHQRSVLMAGDMPDGWRVSLGLMADKECAGNSFHRSVRAGIEVGDGDHIPLLSTYFCVESAVFYTLSSVSDDTLYWGLLAAGRSEMTLPTSAVWPINQPFDKSLGTGLSRDDLLDIQRHFGPVDL